MGGGGAGSVNVPSSTPIGRTGLSYSTKDGSGPGGGGGGGGGGAGTPSAPGAGSGGPGTSSQNPDLVPVRSLNGRIIGWVNSKTGEAIPAPAPNGVVSMAEMSTRLQQLAAETGLAEGLMNGILRALKGVRYFGGAGTSGGSGGSAPPPPTNGMINDPTLVDSNVVVAKGRQYVIEGRNVVQSVVSPPELRNAVNHSNLKGVPAAASEIPTVGLPSVDTSINVRGQLPPGPGRFGDGVIGGTALERGYTLETYDKALQGVVNSMGGRAVRP